LAAVCLAELDAGDLGDGVGLVGGLEVTGQQRLFGHGLGCLAGVDAGGTQVEQLFSAEEVGGVDHGGVDHHVVVDELGRPSGVGHDAADGARHQEDVFGTVGLEPVVDGGLVAEIELFAGGGHYVFEAAGAEFAQYSRADEAGVACNE